MMCLAPDQSCTGKIASMTFDGIMGTVDAFTGNVPGAVMSAASVASGLVLGVCKDYGTKTVSSTTESTP